jgi:signal peptidase II
LGGSSFHFFNAIFNVADSSIFIGVMILLIWQKRFFPEHKKVEREAENVSSSSEQQEADLHLQNAIEGTEDD